MKINIKAVALLLIIAATYISCKKKEYSFGSITTPTGLTLTTTIAGVTTALPNGAGTGSVAIKASSTGAITYKIDFGDGNPAQMVPEGTINYKYNNPGTFDYIITVTAVGTGGVSTTTSKKITVFVAYVIPPEIVANLTGGSSKVWITDNLTPGHVGVGPTTSFAPDYYAAGPNERSPCLYDDLITFSKDANGNVLMAIDNKGQSFVIAASTGFYGVAGPDNCYTIDVAAARKLAFMDATSASTSANSTRVQFIVPGNGLINFGTGGNTYEILSLTATTITLRNIGIDGLAWYQKLKVKP
jgi:hypothetical protein